MLICSFSDNSKFFNSKQCLKILGVILILSTTVLIIAHLCPQRCDESGHHFLGAPEAHPGCHPDPQSPGHPNARPWCAGLTQILRPRFPCCRCCSRQMTGWWCWGRQRKERKIEKLFQTFQERRADLSENILNFLTPSLILTFLSLTNACRKWAAFLPLVTALGWEGHHVVTWPSLSPDLKYRCTTRCRGTSRDTCAAVIPCWENTWFLLQWGTGELAWKQNSSSSELVYLQTSLCLEMRTQLGCKLWLQQLEERQCCPHVEALVKFGGGGDETFSSCIQY